MSTIESISDISLRKQHMNSSREEDLISLTFINLDVLVVGTRVFHKSPIEF